MPLTAESEAILANLAEQGVKALDEMPAAEGREYFNTLFATPPEDQEAVGRVEDLEIPVAGGTIPARLYVPEGATNPAVMVHFHGGGWVYMNLATHDGYCRTLANRAGVAVVAVEYRKAPEHPFPVPFDDCYAALEWVHANAASLGVDGSKMGVVGDSAGGNLAAAVALAARDRNGPKIGVQILTYPAVDRSMSAASIEENAAAPLLGKPQMAWFWDHYTSGGADDDDTRLSPLAAASLAGLPPALVSTAEFDPLRDEGDAYAGKLGEAGVEVEHLKYPGVFHGFLLMAKIIPEGAQLIDSQVAFIKRHLG